MLHDRKRCISDDLGLSFGNMYAATDFVSFVVMRESLSGGRQHGTKQDCILVTLSAQSAVQ